MCKIVVNDMLKALDNHAVVDVSISASINVSEGFGRGVNNKVQEITLLLDGRVRPVESEFLDFLDNVGFKIRKAPANNSQKVKGCWSPCLKVVVFEVVVKESFRVVVEHI